MEQREMFRPSIMNAVCWQMMDLLRAKRRRTAKPSLANYGNYWSSGSGCSRKRISPMEIRHVCQWCGRIMALHRAIRKSKTASWYETSVPTTARVGRDALPLERTSAENRQMSKHDDPCDQVLAMPGKRDCKAGGCGGIEKARPASIAYAIYPYVFMYICLRLHNYLSSN